jgi:hypothetical protein
MFLNTSSSSNSHQNSNTVQKNHHRHTEYNPLSTLEEFSDDDDDDVVVLQQPRKDYPTRNTNPNNTAVDSEYTQPKPQQPPNPSSQQQQQLLFLQQQQNVGLEMLEQHVSQLGQMSLQISDELDSHNRILDDMDTDFDEAISNLDYVTQTTKQFIQASGGTNNFILIVSLIGISIVLFLLILYT